MHLLELLTPQQIHLLLCGRVPAMTTAQLSLLRRLRQEDPMVAKLSGLGRFAAAVKQLNGDGDEMAGELEALVARSQSSKAALKNALAGAHGALDVVDSLTAAFGNGGPPLGDSAAQPASPSSPSPSTANPPSPAA